MARYAVRKTRSSSATHYEEYDAEIEVPRGEDVNEVMENLPDSKWGWSNDWYEDDFNYDDEYEIIECIEPDRDEDYVHGTPEDFGLEQAALLSDVA